jgi:hypothetical protein
MNGEPVDKLEMRAMEERQRLHDRATELKSKLEGTRENLRENLSVEKQSREHFGPAAVMVSVVGLLAGYAVTGMFTGR